MVSYSDYWKDMTELISGNLVKLDNETIAMTMYQDMLYQIGQYALNFKDAGVSKAELIKELDDIESHIKSDISGTGGDKSYQENVENKKHRKAPFHRYVYDRLHKRRLHCHR